MGAILGASHANLSMGDYRHAYSIAYNDSGAVIAPFGLVIYGVPHAKRLCDSHCKNGGEHG